MNLMDAIGLLSSFITLEEAGRSWVLTGKDKLKRKEIDINNWNSDDPLVQACLDRFKTDMGDKYRDHIFSEEEIQEIIRGFFEQNSELRIGNEEKKQMTQIIEDILYAYNEYTKSLMSSGERTLHNTLSSDYSINEKKADAGQIISVINILCEKMKDDYRIEMQFESVLVTLIASVLIMPDVTDEHRNILIEEWIKRIKKIFLNQSYVAEVNMVRKAKKRTLWLQNKCYHQTAFRNF